jgi:hypothetical protein
MPEKGEINANTNASIKTGSSSGFEGNWVTFEIDPDDLVKGENVLCTSVHQFDADSSDLVIDVELFKATLEEFAAATKAAEAKAQRETEEKEKAAAIAAANVNVPAVQPNLLQIFDSRVNPQVQKVKQLIKGLKRMIGITDDQVAELVLCADNALARLRADVELRSADDAAQQNVIRNENVV